MKKGKTFEVCGRKVAYQGKRQALRWARKAQEAQWANAKELRDQREIYSKEDAPELYGLKHGKGGKLVQAKDEDGNPVEPFAPGSMERHLDLCEQILSDCGMTNVFEELMEADRYEEMLELSLEIMNAHALTEKQVLS